MQTEDEKKYVTIAIYASTHEKLRELVFRKKDKKIIKLLERLVDTEYATLTKPNE